MYLFNAFHHCSKWPAKRYVSREERLEEGDLLSPSLFVLSMEYLSRLFKKASTLPRFEYHQHYKKLGLTHLLFTDDLIIFCKTRPTSLKIMTEAFQAFTICTGLKANLAKSQIVFGGDCNQVHQERLNIIGFTEGQLHLRYLGVLITSSRLSKLECKALVEKISGKITTWSSRHISYAARAVLVNTVLFGMLNFWAQIFILPQEVVDQITQLCRNFLWEGGRYSKILYVS